MADLEDITGWREEYRKIEESGGEEWLTSYFERELAALDLQTPISDVLKYMETVYADEELREAVKQALVWEKVLLATKEGMHETNPRYKECPHEALDLLRDFCRWYCLKGNYEPVEAAFAGAGEHALFGVLEGKFPAIRSKKTIDFILKEYDEWVVPDHEGLTDE